MVQVRRALLLLACLPAGCAQGGDGGPVGWWHQLQGGAIARERPAPPNADAPYPKLASVPARPQALPAAERSRIASGLRQDRANAEFAAASVPIVPPVPVRASPPPPPDPNGGNAVMQAADASPAPAARVAPARPAVAAAPMPGMPLTPPPPPVLPGVPRATRPSPAPVAPPESARRPPIVPGQPVAVAFAAGSAVLPPGIELALARLAATRDGRAMRVAGFGAATGDDTAVQAAALPLAFARAEAIANALARAGVPLTAIRLTAAAQGQGGVAAIAD